jgi:hypothetical protein
MKQNSADCNRDATSKMLRKNLMPTMPNSNPHKSHAIHAPQQQQQRALPKRPASGSATSWNRHRSQSVDHVLGTGDSSSSMVVDTGRKAVTPLPITPHSNGAPQKNTESAVQTLLAFGSPAAATHQHYKNFFNPVTAHIKKQNNSETVVKPGEATAAVQFQQRGSGGGGVDSDGDTNILQRTISNGEPSPSLNPYAMARMQRGKGGYNARDMFPLPRCEKYSSAAAGIYGGGSKISRSANQSPIAHHRKRRPASQNSSNKEDSTRPVAVSVHQPPLAWGSKAKISAAQARLYHLFCYHVFLSAYTLLYCSSVLPLLICLFRPSGATFI